MRTQIHPCPLCLRFTLKAPDLPPGHGYCEGYEKVRRHDDDNRACPLWIEARNVVERRRWAEQQQQSTGA